MVTKLKSTKTKRNYSNGKLVSIVKEIVILTEINGKLRLKYRKSRSFDRNDFNMSYDKIFDENFQQFCDNNDLDFPQNLLHFLTNCFESLKNNQKFNRSNEIKTNYKVFKRIFKILKIKLP